MTGAGNTFFCSCPKNGWINGGFLTPFSERKKREGRRGRKKGKLGSRRKTELCDMWKAVQFRTGIYVQVWKKRKKSLTCVLFSAKTNHVGKCCISDGMPTRGANKSTEREKSEEKNFLVFSRASLTLVLSVFVCCSKNKKKTKLPPKHMKRQKKKSFLLAT